MQGVDFRDWKKRALLTAIVLGLVFLANNAGASDQNSFSPQETGFSADYNLDMLVTGSGVIYCSTEPQGTTADEWWAHCYNNQIVYATQGQTFYALFNIYNVVHSTQFNYTAQERIYDPNSTEYYSSPVYSYSGTDTQKTYRCIKWAITINGPIGNYTTNYYLHDNIDGTDGLATGNIHIQTTCLDECPYSGQKQCSASYSQTCGNYDSDPCLEWNTGEYCSEGCDSGTGNCINCTSHSYKACYSNDLYWYDSCNQREEMYQDCGNTTYSSNYCYNGDVYRDVTQRGCSGSSCYTNTYPELVQDCTDGCLNGQCETCYSHHHSSCVGDDVYWFDSCGNQEELKEDCRLWCYNGNTCENGCLGNFKVQAKNFWNAPITNATVSYDGAYGEGWEFAGLTNSQGILEFYDIQPGTCSRTYHIKTITADGIDLGTKYMSPMYEGDLTFNMFTQQWNQLPSPNGVTIIASPTQDFFYYGEAVEFLLNTKDWFFSPIANVLIGIIPKYNPAKKTTAITDSSGNTEYSDSEAPIGKQKYTFIGSKAGYRQGFTEKTVTIEALNNLTVNVRNFDGQPIKNADVWIEGEQKATTNTQGNANLQLGDGDYEIKIKCPNGTSCTTKQTNLSRNKTMNFECDCSLSLRVDTDNIQNVPLANVYIYIDGEEKGITNAFGFLLVKEMGHGNHEVTTYYKVSEEEGGQTYYQTKNILVENNPSTLEFELDPSNSIQYSEITPEDVNAQIAPAIAIVAYAIIDVASITLDIDELCACIHKNSITKDFGIVECVNSINACMLNGMDAESCVERIRNMNAGPESCPMEYGALAFDIGPLTGSGLAIKAGKAVAIAAPVVKGGKAIGFLDDGVKAVVRYSDDLATYLKNGLEWVGTWLSDALRFKKAIKTSQGLLSELATQGAEIIGSKAGKRAQQELIEAGTEKVGKDLLEEGLEGIAKLEQKEGIEGLDKLKNEIAAGASNARFDNGAQLKGALTNAEIAARPEYLDEADSLMKPLRTSAGSTDADIVLKNQKIVESKNAHFLASARKGDRVYNKFANQINLLLRYQTENGISSGVEVISKQGFSDDILTYLNTLKNSDSVSGWGYI